MQPTKQAIKDARVKYNNPYAGIIMRTIHQLEGHQDEFGDLGELRCALVSLRTLLVQWPASLDWDAANILCAHYTTMVEKGITRTLIQENKDDSDFEPILPLKRKQPTGWITREDRRNRALGPPRRTIIRKSRRLAHTK